MKLKAGKYKVIKYLKSNPRFLHNVTGYCDDCPISKANLKRSNLLDEKTYDIIGAIDCYTRFETFAKIISEKYFEMCDFDFPSYTCEERMEFFKDVINKTVTTVISNE